MKTEIRSKQWYKRFFSILLAVLMVFGSVPPVSFAVPINNFEIVDPGTSDLIEAPNNLSNGQVWTNKNVVYNGDGAFTITLSAVGQDYKLTEPQPQELLDVVLILDRSGSMDDDNKLENMQAAAKNAVDIILSVAGNRIAIVKYNSSASLVRSFSTDANDLKGDIDDLSARSGTNIQNALLIAEQTIENRSDDSRKPIVILMSDGYPTYYQSSLTDHSGTRVGDGENTSDAHVWNTIRQAMQLKGISSSPEIYTIGFGVSGNYSEATLMPTEANTSPYRPNSYSGESRDILVNGLIQYESESNNFGSSWSSWNPAESGDDDYEAPTGTPVYDIWTPFSAYSTSPSDFLNPHIISGSIQNESDTDNNGKSRRKIAYFNYEQTGMEFRNITAAKSPFNHKYWSDGSSIVPDGAEDIFNAFVEIVNALVYVKPIDYTGGGIKDYSDIVISDTIGSGFEVVGALPSGVSQSGSTVTWTIDGDSFETMAADSTDLDLDKVASVSFKVRVKDSAPLGKHYTNTSASAAFSVNEDNPFYEYTDVEEALLNNGWLTLKALEVEASVRVYKHIEGPGLPAGTFTFSFFYDNEGGTAIGNPVSITLEDEMDGSALKELTLPGNLFDNNGELVLYVQENETSSDPYWNYDNNERKEVVINKNSPSTEVHFTNVYTPKGTLTVSKVWEGSGPQSAVSFDLQKEVSQGQWETISSGHGLASEIGNLDLGTKYRVIETPVQDYNPVYSPAFVEFTAGNLEKNIEITNKYVQPVGKITVNKLWDDEDDAAGDRPESLTFTYEGPQDQAGELILSADSGWTNTLETETFGEYTFTESIPLDYTVDEEVQSKTILINPVESREVSLTFTNTYVIPTGALAVSKVWENEGSDDSYRPESITLKVFKEGEDTGLSVIFPQKDDTPWSHVFEGLEFGTYTVEEIDVLDYDVTYSAPAELTKEIRKGGITVTNTFTNPKGSIAVSKSWVEGGLDEEVVRPASITLTLLDSEENEVASINLPKEGDLWTHTFEGLDLDGMTYTVEESATGEDADQLAAYELNVIYGGESGFETGITIDKEDRNGSASLINTYAKGTVAVVKVWEDGDNPENELPEQINVQLYKKVITLVPLFEEQIVDLIIDPEFPDADPTPVYEEVQIGEEEVIEETLVDQGVITRDDPTWIVYGLDIAENTSYFIVELGVPFYTSSVGEPVVLSEEAPNGQIIVTNTYDDPKGSLTVTKEWKHGNNPNPAEEVTVVLYKEGVEVDSATFSSSHAFENLELGYSYTISENPVENYKINYNGFTHYVPVKGEDSVEAGQVKITNKYIPEKGHLTVEKLWEGKVGGPVEITIRRAYDDTEDNKFIRTITLSEENAWIHTFKNLPLYGPGGVSYTYSASESGEDLVLYTAENLDAPTLVKNETVKITITNTYTPDKGQLTITKEWLDAEGESMEAPVESIAVFLVVEGKAEESSMVLSAENNWTVTRSELNVEKTYSVVEASYHEAFEVSYSSDRITLSPKALEQTLTITNRRTLDNPNIDVIKSVDKYSGALVEGKVIFNYIIRLENTGNRTLTNLKVLDVMTGPEGSTRVYSPAPNTEGSGGEKEFNLAGSLAPGESTEFFYSVTVDKSGEYRNDAFGSGTYEGETYSDESYATNFVKAPGLKIVKLVIGASSLTANSGTFNYELRIINDGDSSLENVKIQDVLSGAGTYNYSGPLSFDSDTKTFTVGDLPSDSEDVVIQYSVSFNSPGTYGNIATVTGEYYNYGDESQEPDFTTYTDSDSASVTLRRRPAPEPDPQPEPDPIPEEPVPEAVPDPVVEDVVELPQDIIPLGVVTLPQTGEIPSALFFGMGSLISGLGIFLRKRNK